MIGTPLFVSDAANVRRRLQWDLDISPALYQRLVCSLLSRNSTFGLDIPMWLLPEPDRLPFHRQGQLRSSFAPLLTEASTSKCSVALATVKVYQLSGAFSK